MSATCIKIWGVGVVMGLLPFSPFWVVPCRAGLTRSPARSPSGPCRPCRRCSPCAMVVLGVYCGRPFTTYTNRGNLLCGTELERAEKMLCMRVCRHPFTIGSGNNANRIVFFFFAKGAAAVVGVQQQQQQL